MPIYEYRCESCGDKFEKLVRRSTDALEAGCPSCGEKHLEQQYSTFAARVGEGSTLLAGSRSINRSSTDCVTVSSGSHRAISIVQPISKCSSPAAGPSGRSRSTASGCRQRRRRSWKGGGAADRK